MQLIASACASSARKRPHCVCLLLWLTIAMLPARALAWGTHVSVDEMAELNLDWSNFVRSFDALQMPPDKLAQQRELLGIDDATTNVDIAQYLIEHGSLAIAVTLNQGIRVIRNPSASCPVAAAVLERLLRVDKQSQVLGFIAEVADKKGHTLAEAESILLKEVEYRCIAEAYDLCVDSGSVQPFIGLAVFGSRQFQLLGIDGSEFISSLATRMLNCGVYEVQITTDAANRVTYPFVGLYDQHVQSHLQGNVRLTFGEGQLPTNDFELGNGQYVGVMHYEFLPTIRCEGTHGEYCRLLEWPPLSETADAAMKMADFRVEYSFERANLRYNIASESTTFTTDPITWEKYTPPGMAETRIAVRLSAPHLRIETDFPGGYIVEEDDVSPMFLRRDDKVSGTVTITEGKDHQGDHVEFVHKFEHLRTVGSVVSKKVADESGKFVLRHHPEPMTPLDYSELPLLPIPQMRKPLRPPRMTTPNPSP